MTTSTANTKLSAGEGKLSLVAEMEEEVGRGGGGGGGRDERAIDGGHGGGGRNDDKDTQRSQMTTVEIDDVHDSDDHSLGRVYTVPVRNRRSSGIGAASSSAASSWATTGSGNLGSASVASTVKSPARKKKSSSSTTTTTTKPPVAEKKSIQNRIVDSALFGTVELLKLAGGATLSTTGRLVAPPLRVTKDILLPSMWHAAKDYASSVTPQRVKDWLRIFSSSISHFFLVLKNTNSGKVFRERAITVTADLVDCASSEVSRQIIADSMSLFVRFAEAMK